MDRRIAALCPVRRIFPVARAAACDLYHQLRRIAVRARPACAVVTCSLRLVQRERRRLYGVARRIFVSALQRAAVQGIIDIIPRRCPHCRRRHRIAARRPCHVRAGSLRAAHTADIPAAEHIAVHFQRCRQRERYIAQGAAVVTVDILRLRLFARRRAVCRHIRQRHRAAVFAVVRARRCRACNRRRIRVRIRCPADRRPARRCFLRRRRHCSARRAVAVVDRIRPRIRRRVEMLVCRCVRLAPDRVQRLLRAVAAAQPAVDVARRGDVGACRPDLVMRCRIRVPADEVPAARHVLRRCCRRRVAAVRHCRVVHCVRRHSVQIEVDRSGVQRVVRRQRHRRRRHARDLVVVCQRCAVDRPAREVITRCRCCRKVRHCRTVFHVVRRSRRTGRRRVDALLRALSDRVILTGHACAAGPQLHRQREVLARVIQAHHKAAVCRNRCARRRAAARRCALVVDIRLFVGKAGERFLKRRQRQRRIRRLLHRLCASVLRIRVAAVHISRVMVHRNIDVVRFPDRVDRRLLAACAGVIHDILRVDLRRRHRIAVLVRRCRIVRCTPALERVARSRRLRRAQRICAVVRQRVRHRARSAAAAVCVIHQIELVRRPLRLQRHVAVFTACRCAIRRNRCRRRPVTVRRRGLPSGECVTGTARRTDLERPFDRIRCAGLSDCAA